MTINALKAALEGLGPDDTGAIEGQAIVEPLLPESEMIQEMVPVSLPPREEMVAEVSVQLEAHYAESDDVFTQADAINHAIEENETAHAVMREDIRTLREQVEAVHGSMEMLSRLATMESIDADTLAMANVNLKHLARRTGLQAPSLESIDGNVSMEGLLDFLKAGAEKIKNWFKDLSDKMNLDALRERRNGAAFVARIRRLQAVIDKLPTELGRPVQPCQYKDQYLYGLFEDNTPLKFETAALKASVKRSTDLYRFATGVNSKEHLENIKAISAQMPSLLMSIGDDGGEKATRDMVGKVKVPPSLAKEVTYGKEVGGGVTYREGNYRPSIRVASWVQHLVEIAEKDRLPMQFRRSGRITLDYCDISTIEGTLESMAEFLDDVDNMYSSYMGDLIEAYNDAVKSYNKTLGLARSTDHAELTSEVWKAIDLASFVMMESFNVVLRETWGLTLPSSRQIDSLLYVFEEQLLRYVKVNR
jgi:hypothetical protein